MTNFNSNFDFLSDKTLSMEILLDNICQQLQLDPTRAKVMDTAYKAVTQIIDKDEGFFGSLDPVIYAIGSVGIGTTTKPYKREEFDLDFVVTVDYNWSRMSQQEFLDKLFHLLNGNGTYKGKVERLRFCVRINYKSQFHMDIMPACKIAPENDKLKVPDTKRLIWANRNPKGFMAWFKNLFITDTKSIRLNEYYNYRHSLIEKAEIQDLPAAVPYEATQPLQRAIQLIKRRRDVYFENDSQLATSSIILTTIAGMFYQQETSIYDTIDGIITRVNELIKKRGIYAPIEIVNPADLNEDERLKEKFSDKWKEGEKGRKRYEAFVNFMNDFNNEWTSIKNTKGRPDAILKQLFGHNVTEKAFEHQVLLTNNMRSKGGLHINKSTGLLTLTETNNTVNIKKTTLDGAYTKSKG